MNVLVLNCGSSSAKFAVMDAANSRELVAGIAQRLGTPQATLDWKVDGQKSSRAIAGAGHDAALRRLGGPRVAVPPLARAGRRGTAAERGWTRRLLLACAWW